MSGVSYENFDLLILPNGDHYQARVTDAPAGQASGAFQVPFSLTELYSLGWLGERSFRHLKLSGADAPDVGPLHPRTFGKRLFDAVFAGGVGKSLVRSCDLAKARGKGLRIRLRIDQDAPELADLPWEYLYVPDWSKFPALSDQTPLVRYIELNQPERPLPATLPLHILVVVSNPTDVPQLQVEQEWTRLQSALTDLQAAHHVVLERLSAPTLDALQDRLREVDVHILHFIGHGFFDQETNEGCLLFENENESSQRVSADQLATLLQDEGLRLVFLNACEGALSGQDDSFAGVAARLVQQGIPAVLAMQFAVSDQAALALAHEFYKAIADHYPLDAAVSEARKKIYVAGNEREWGTPVLFMRSPDGYLFDIGKTQEQEQRTGLSASPAWHFAGSLWLVTAGLVIVLFVGLGYLLLEPWPLLRNSLAMMSALLSGLLGLFGVRGAQIPLRQWSYLIAKEVLPKIVIGAFGAVSLVLWATVGLTAIRNNACAPLPCPPAGVRNFAISNWENLTPGASLYEGIWTNGTRNILYEKLGKVPQLQPIALDSPQIAEGVSPKLDLWIKGGFQKIERVQLSANVVSQGIQGPTITVSDTVNEASQGVEAHIIALQNQLAEEILAGLGISVTPTLQAVIENTPTGNGEALALNNTAAFMFQQGIELEAVEEMLQQAIALDPHYASPHNNLGRLLVKRNELDQAITEYQRAITLSPDTPLYHFNLGAAYERKGDLAASAQAYQEAIRLDPAYVKAFNNLGFTYLLLDELDEAQAVLERGLAIDANNPNLHKNQGRVYLEQGELEQAAAELQKAIDLFVDGTYGEAWYFLALARKEQGDVDAACAALQQYLPVADLDESDRPLDARTLFAQLQCN